MPERDQDRLEAAERVRGELAIENQLSRAQARTYVRCLQTTWQVPTIQWTERASARQLADARRLLHAAHIFRSIEGQGSERAIDCYRRTGEILEWLARAADTVRHLVPIELLAAGAYQLGGLPAMASGLLLQVGSDHLGVQLYGAFLRADFDRVLNRAVLFWRRHPDLTTADASAMLLTAMRGEAGEAKLARRSPGRSALSWSEASGWWPTVCAAAMMSGSRSRWASSMRSTPWRPAPLATTPR
jgi:hypothetical protein